MEMSICLHRDSVHAQLSTSLQCEPTSNTIVCINFDSSVAAMYSYILVCSVNLRLIPLYVHVCMNFDSSVAVMCSYLLVCSVNLRLIP